MDHPGSNTAPSFVEEKEARERERGREKGLGLERTQARLSVVAKRSNRGVLSYLLHHRSFIDTKDAIIVVVVDRVSSSSILSR